MVDETAEDAGPVSLKYAVLSPEGDVQAVGSMHDSPQAAALLAAIGGVEITAAQADQIGRNPGQWRLAPDGTLGPRPPPEVPLAEAQAKASAAVDAAAEAVRLRFLTPGSGQALVYQGKRDEALAFVARFPTAEAATAGGTGDFPLIAAEVGVTADTPWEVVQVMLAMSARWTLAAAQIENVRLTAKAAIAAASTAAAVQAVLGGIAWPSDLPS